MSTLCLPIETDRLTLRSFEPGDIDGLTDYHALPAIQRYAFTLTRHRDEVATALKVMCAQVSLQRPGDILTLAMICRKNGQLAGHVSLHWSDATAGQGEVRFLVNPRHAGQGLVTEALEALFDLAFGHFQIHRLFVRCDGRSRHSIKLVQRLGMRLEAHYREHALFQGEWDEELHFAMLDREWQQATTVSDLPPRHRVA